VNLDSLNLVRLLRLVPPLRTTQHKRHNFEESFRYLKRKHQSLPAPPHRIILLHFHRFKRNYNGRRAETQHFLMPLRYTARRLLQTPFWAVHQFIGIGLKIWTQKTPFPLRSQGYFLGVGTQRYIRQSRKVVLYSSQFLGYGKNTKVAWWVVPGSHDRTQKWSQL